MADPLALVEALLADHFVAVGGEGADPVVRPSDHADAQANGALGLAKRLGRQPREVAADIVAAALRSGSLDGIATLEVAGPGFINVTLDDTLVGTALHEAMNDERLGVRPAAQPERVVVDYSHPNVAKEMHVGHGRTTLIGDSIVRLLRYVGHDVISENHIGDWGTPFGMLIEHLVDLAPELADPDPHAGEAAIATLDLTNPGPFYQAARAKFDASDEFKERSRARVVLLQQGTDAVTTKLWNVLVDQSIEYFQGIYAQLGVLLTRDDVVGESFYQPSMPAVIEGLDAAGLLHESDGAQVVWVPGYTNRDGQPLPLIVQARTGGFNYATSDLACVIDRVERLRATLLVYVVGTPQSQHLAMVWKAAEMAGWLTPPARAVHVNFGNVLGEDRKMLKSRSGDPARFVDFVDEALRRGRALVDERSPDLPEAERAELGAQIGIGAFKYAELSSDRIKDYIFDWDRMLSFDGNTAPYLQYAHARMCSIFRRAGVDRASLRHTVPTVAEPAERALALQVLRFDGAVGDTLETFSPHKLCTYLYDLARTFTGFYEACPVLRDDVDAQTRASRLALCDAAARTLASGLDLLGIESPERM
jgi:arginyl-tRNA synthetase